MTSLRFPKNSGSASRLSNFETKSDENKGEKSENEPREAGPRSRANPDGSGQQPGRRIVEGLYENIPSAPQPKPNAAPACLPQVAADGW